MQVDEYKFAYYYTLKNSARLKVAEALNQKIKEAGNRTAWDRLTICSINIKALEYARLEWPKFYGPETHAGFEYSWERLVHKFQHNPAYFDLAIWQKIQGNDVLQGLALGRPSSGKKTLTLTGLKDLLPPHTTEGAYYFLYWRA